MLILFRRVSGTVWWWDICESIFYVILTVIIIVNVFYTVLTIVLRDALSYWFY